MSSGEETAPEGASAGQERPPGRVLAPEELRRLATELARAVGRHGSVTVEGGALHLYTPDRTGYRAASRAAARLTHWPAGVRVVVHRSAPRVPPPRSSR